MNQEKIGMFIGEERKNKNLTQEQLANKLGVTSKSISRWENGKTMPDISLFEPLCDELNITINELLKGQRLDNKKNQSKISIESLIDYSKYIKKKKQKNNSNNIIYYEFITNAYESTWWIKRSSGNKWINKFI